MLKNGVYSLEVTGQVDAVDIKKKLYDAVPFDSFYFKECEIVGEFSYVSFVACKDIPEVSLESIVEKLSKELGMHIELV